MMGLVCLLLASCVAMSAAGVGAPRQASKSSVRSLHVRSIPAVQGYSSNVYEIYMQPYSYNIRPLTAGVELKGDEADESKGVRGELTFTQLHPPTGPVFITGNITGLAKGPHGLHVHEFGDHRKGCSSAGPHYNPYMQPHGGPIDPFRHIGDLGNVVVGDDGVAKVMLWDQMISLSGSHSILGRSIVVHAMKDDYGRGGDVESVTTGNAGGRLACGVIGYTSPESLMIPPFNHGPSVFDQGPTVFDQGPPVPWDFSGPMRPSGFEPGPGPRPGPDMMDVTPEPHSEPAAPVPDSAPVPDAPDSAPAPDS